MDGDNIKPHFPALDSIVRPARDAIRAASTLGVKQARYLVDTYYQIQETRKAAANQAGAMDRATTAGNPEEPHETLDWLITQLNTMEHQLTRAFTYYAEASEPGRWLLSITGIGPVLAANLLARVSVRPWKCQNPDLRTKRKPDEEPVFPCDQQSPCTPACGFVTIETGGGFWRFAGLDPTVKWEAGTIRPWNAALKVACWKASDSWVKLKGHADSFYSRVYVDRKAYEVARNDRGECAPAAAQMLAAAPKHKQKATYAQGKLPAGHLDARARRYAVKLFLSHLHEVMYEDEFGRKPPKPFAIDQAGHAHHIPPPNWPLMT